MTTTIETNTETTKFDIASITKLNSENYPVWKMRLTCLFKSHNLMKIVDGTLPRPDQSGSDLEHWEQGNIDAETIMLLTISDNKVQSISDCATAAEIWKKLEAMYLSTSGELKQLLLEKFHIVMASSEKSPVKAANEIRNYASQLRSMGVEISDAMEMGRIMSSLVDEKFRDFIEAWRSVDVAKQSSALLLARLKIWDLEEEQVKAHAKTGEGAKAYSSGKRGGQPKRTKKESAEFKTRTKTKCHGYY